MKKKLLIITINYNTKNGMIGYLSSILRRYLDIDAMLVKDVTIEILRQYELVLFSAELVRDAIKSILEPDINYIISNRTFNHTYLNKILMLPPGESVYLINDSKQSTEIVIEQLNIFGLNQYNFIPYYPGCGEPNLNIQYAVTLGEIKLVPAHIKTIIDIGNRIVDISTIIEIIVYFNLPISLVNEITKNYINHILQVLKLTNSQLNEAMNTKMLTQSIVNNVSTGLCLIDKNGFIKLVNQSFINMLSLYGGHLVDTSLNTHFQKYDLFFDWKTQSNNTFFIKNLKNEIVKFSIQEIENNKLESQFLIHSDIESIKEEKLECLAQNIINKYTAELNFNDYITIDNRSKKLIETAKRISLTDYPILIQGENGTGKSVLAQSIHNNSKRRQYPFISINISASNHDILEHELLGYEKTTNNDSIEKKPSVFELANKGTIYLEGIHDLPYDLQCLLQRILEKKAVRRIGAYHDTSIDVRLIVSSSSKDLFSMVSTGQFREDLFYNLNTVSLETVPLRNRRADIPFHFHNSLKNVFNNSNATLERMCSDSLLEFLLSYSWPGNVKEINNLCKYFSCIRTQDKLTMRDLPKYLQNQKKEDQIKLSPLENKILAVISQNPKIGRSKIHQLLTSQGTVITEGKIRGLLQSLFTMKLIKINRTKGGCEITEEGELYLQN